MDRLLAAIAHAAMDLLGSERAFVLTLVGEDPVVSASASRGPRPGLPSLSMVRRAMEQKKEVIIGDLSERADLRAAMSVQAMKLGCVMCAPLIEGDVVLGAIYTDSHVATDQELSEAARYMRALAAHAAIAITNARHMAELARRAEWAAEIAHDIRSPASGILMVAESLAQSNPRPAELKAGLNDIIKLAQRSIHLAEALLKDGSQPPIPVDLSTLLTELISVACRSHKVHVELHIAEPLVVLGKPTELERVFSNLLCNAIKYNPPGESLHVRLEREADQAMIQIADSGPGIPPEALERIFVRGVQAPGAQAGFGLGLSIVRTIVEAHQGSVYARNLPGGGAVFQVHLPLCAGLCGPASQG